MDEVDRAFRDGLRDAVEHKPALGPVDLDQVIAKGEAQVSPAWSHRSLTRVLAVAAGLVIVVSLGFGAWNLFGRSAVTGVPVGTPQTVTDSPATVRPGTSGPVTPTTYPAEGSVQVRLRNDSTVAFDKVVVNFSGGPARNYGALAPGASSGYLQPPDLAYQYAFVGVTIGDQTFRLQPIDFVGESELAPGRYTYALSVSGDDLRLEFEVDD
ncbi:MAG: hypothetical protein WAS07_12770 [Micropruina sp.]